MRKQKEIDIHLRLSAQRALWGHAPSTLRTASIDIKNNVILWKCIFDKDATDNDFELLRMAGTEIIADFSHFNIEEEMTIIPFPTKTEDLEFLVYYRHEHNYYEE